jgi:hypothetical protein
MCVGSVAAHAGSAKERVDHLYASLKEHARAEKAGSVEAQ